MRWFLLLVSLALLVWLGSVAWNQFFPGQL